MSCELNDGEPCGHRLVVRTRRGEPYAVHTLRLDGDPGGDLEIRVDSQGTGQAVFRGVAAGRHVVELVQCGTKLTALCR